MTEATTEFCSIPKKEVEEMKEQILRAILNLKKILETLDTYSKPCH